MQGPGQKKSEKYRQFYKEYDVNYDSVNYYDNTNEVNVYEKNDNYS